MLLLPVSIIAQAGLVQLQIQHQLLLGFAESAYLSMNTFL